MIIPAHNEEEVIKRCLDSLTSGAKPGELEVLVVCNGCRDGTADIVRGFGGPVRVIETEIALKTNAINLGEQAATGFPRIYVDADVVITLESLRLIADALRQGPAMAAAPRVETIFAPSTSWGVRAHYAFWMALPYVREGMVAAGVYAVSQQGRQRFGAFPDVISDDGYFRLQFSPNERVEVSTAQSKVFAPTNLHDLIRIKTRSRVGRFQLQTRFPDLYAREAQSKHYGRALLSILKHPRLYLYAIPYVYVYLVSRYRARRAAQGMTGYLWERDDSSRQTAV